MRDKWRKLLRQKECRRKRTPKGTKAREGETGERSIQTKNEKVPVIINLLKKDAQLNSQEAKEGEEEGRGWGKRSSFPETL